MTDAHVVMPDGQTIGTHIKPRIAEAYAQKNQWFRFCRRQGGSHERVGNRNKIVAYAHKLAREFYQMWGTK